ncbi:glycosyltransferase WbuB [Sphaerochaeta halotolerans]|uniref:Glycosyltransferase WbuB n=1 Tax=Sphaerochaeta halotolerans TaxID=2293840 RepID=A0A372MDH9_9SPIR|nr:glycosyltransferase family 4 protein [Sphaerochaeta halotolerans]RFU93814.1 glycosyltransferase WbuB [Sphaerochaeta halotolerans]
MKILCVCQYYYPENFQVTPICEQLVADGYEVTVLTGLPNYPTGIIPDDYKKSNRDETINGVHVVRCKEIGRKNGPVWLGINYISFYISSMKMVDKLPADFDIVFVYQLSPVFMGLPGRKYAMKHNVPLFLYCCDLWPESIKMYVKNERNVFYKWARYVSRKVYVSCNRIAVQSLSFINYLNITHSIDKNKLIYIPAFADEKYLTIDFTPEDKNFIDFLFLGNIGIAQNLFSVVNAFKIACEKRSMRLHIVGDGTCLQDLQHYVVEVGLKDTVFFYGRRSVDQMPRFYKIADACIVSLNADNATGYTLPSKVQGYMAAGKPIIGMIDGSAREVIKESNCGICVPANDVDGFANALCSFARDKCFHEMYANNGRSYFKKNFSKKGFMNALEKEISSLGNNA